MYNRDWSANITISPVVIHDSDCITYIHTIGLSINSNEVVQPLLKIERVDIPAYHFEDVRILSLQFLQKEVFKLFGMNPKILYVCVARDSDANYIVKGCFSAKTQLFSEIIPRTIFYDRLSSQDYCDRFFTIYSNDGDNFVPYCI